MTRRFKEMFSPGNAAFLSGWIAAFALALLHIMQSWSAWKTQTQVSDERKWIEWRREQVRAARESRHQSFLPAVNY